MKYIVNTNSQADGYHEVHKTNCDHLPLQKNQKDLGSFINCSDAVKKAGNTYSKVDGCKHCCIDCHTR